MKINYKKILILGVILLQLIFVAFDVNASETNPDNDDLEVTLNCTLNTNSTEIHSTLMPLGTYTIAERPRLDVGSFTNDLSSFDFSSVQKQSNAVFNDPQTENFSENKEYNVTSNSEIEEHELSAPKDSVYEVVMNFSSKKDFHHNVSKIYTAGEYSDTKGSYSGDLDDLKDMGANYISYCATNDDPNHFDSVNYVRGDHYSGSLSDMQTLDSNEYVAYQDESGYYPINAYLYYENALGGDYAYFYDVDIRIYSEFSQYYKITLAGTNYWIYYNEEIHETKERLVSVGSSFQVYMKAYSGYATLYDKIYIDRLVIYRQHVEQKLQFSIDEEYETFDSEHNISLTYQTYNGVEFDMEYLSGSEWISVLDSLSSESEYTTVNNTFSTISGNLDFRLLISSGSTSGSFTDTLISIDRLILFGKYKPFESLEVINFTLSKLGYTYKENITLSERTSERTVTYNNGNLTYYFDSNGFSNYDHEYDLTIPKQNITLNFTINFRVNITWKISYSSQNWAVPSEIDLMINEQDVSDDTYNSGSADFTDYQTEIDVSANTGGIYFKLSMSTDFTFNFDLEIISKTYLSKDFELLSDHEITIESIEFDEDLDIRKVYLNNVEISGSTIYSANVEMDTSEVFTIEVILSDNLYQELDFAYNNLGSGTSYILLEGYTNVMNVYDFNKFKNLIISLLDNHQAPYHNITFDNPLYTPNYTSDESNNLYDSGYSTNTLGNVDVNFSETLGSYNDTVIPNQPNNFTLRQSEFESYGDLQVTDDPSLLNATKDKEYFGTYDFYFNEAGSQPEGWEDHYYSGATWEILDEIDNHQNVLKVQSSGSWVGVKNEISQSYGTIEFWIYPCQTNTRIRFGAGYGDSGVLSGETTALEFYQDGYIRHMSGPTNLQSYSANIWYHVRIDFEKTAGGYLGLAQHTETVYINSVNKGTFSLSGTCAEFSEVGLCMSGGTCYVDSFGYSWDTDYSVDDNLEHAYEIDLDMTLDVNTTTSLDPRIQNLYYGYKTNVSCSDLLLSAERYGVSNKDEISSSSDTSYTYDLFTFNNSHDLFPYDNDKNRFNVTIKGHLPVSFIVYLDECYIEIEYETYSYSNIGYENPTLVHDNATFTIELFCEINITSVYYHNSTDYICENNSVNFTEYSFSFIVYSEIIKSYDISVKLISIQNTTYFVNISNLQFIKRASVLDINNLYHSYYQDDNVSVEIQLRDIYNNPIQSNLINYTIVAPNTTCIVNSSAITNSQGKVSINLSLGIEYNLGFYHLNVSYNSTSEYLSYWKLMSFEVLPISRVVDCSVINLTVNGYLVGGDNFIQLNDTSTFTFDHLNNATFDFSIITKLSHSQTIVYDEFISYSYEFEASNNITQVTCTNAILINIPTNFTTFYIDSLATNNYVVNGNNLTISSLIGETFYEGYDVDLALRYYEDDIRRTQITSNPRTDVNSVIFTEQLITNETFSYWYYHNINSLDITSLSLEHERSGTTISTFTGNLSSRSYFSLSCQQDDKFESRIAIDPNWAINFDIIENTGTYTKIKIAYQADLAINNVSIILDLTRFSIYNENWTVAYQGGVIEASQNTVNNKVIIPGIDFTDSNQILYLEGVSSIPHATFHAFISDQDANKIAENTEVEFYGYLNYPKYGQKFRAVTPDWTSYKVYYGQENYSTRQVGENIIEFSGPGFDPNVTDSYLHFSTRPFTAVTLDYNEANEQITIVINCSLTVDNAYFMAYFSLDGNHELITLQGDIIDVSDSEITGYLTFGMNEVEQGTTIIIIQVNYATPLEVLIQGILAIIVFAIILIAWYKIKKDEELREKIKSKFEVIENKLKKDEGEFQEIKEMKFEDGKTYGKVKK